MPVVYADLTTLAAGLKAASGQKTQLALAGVIRVAAYQIQQRSQQMAPRRTGTLASSITVQFPNPLTAIIGPGVPYGVFQELGTKGPYVILPKRPGGSLVFQVSGKTVFAKKVMHPGLKAQPFMRPAAQEVLAGASKQAGIVGVNMIVAPDRNSG